MPKVIRATAGSIFNIPVAHAAVDELLEWARSHKIKLAVTAADAGKTVFDAQLKESIAFVFGNEAHGIQEALIKAADMALRIPVYGKAESLNVATSAAVCLYEAARQRI
jgi:TrmH family RNA methyltransferase